MTRIEYRYGADSFALDVSGHSGYAPAGDDIVCAGISALVQTLAIRADEIGEDTMIDLPGGGEAHIRSSGDRILDFSKGILEGLQAIAEAYPSNAEVTYTDIRKSC